MTYDHVVGFSPYSKLLELRDSRGWSQRELAELLKVSPQAIHAIETGRYDPTRSLAQRIAEVFDLPVEQVFSRSTDRS